MILTTDHILDLIEKLPINVAFNYVSGGDSKAKLLSIDRKSVKVDIVRINADGSEKNASMTTDILNTLANSIKENKPFKFDNVLNGSGNVRSTMEAIFAHTSEFYSCKIGRVKHLMWVPRIPHEIGKIIDYDSIKDKMRDILRNETFNSQPFQQIFFGAPGTGKSHKIKDDENVKEADKKDLVFRTTFHPDSDYSTFVGAYKPTMKSSERIYSPEELTIKLKEIKTTGTTYPCHKFAAKYWESLKDLTPDSIKQILNACGFTDNYSVEIGKGVAVGQEYLNNPEDGKIIYTFCPQAFTNAYVEAWNTEDEVYLVIEEINRGNCAQIFGDLFQLLDRKNGVSEYPVEADADLQSYLNKALAKTTRTDIPADVKLGKKLMLPSNLYIWATMNTSDQSLFPIDSAFKRRWEWKYIKIKEGKDENGNKLDWKVDVKKDEAGNLLSWWAFIQKINEIIASMTSSADKQLGYFFCCAKDGVIDEETFVSKVIFYLWNDVFKDYGFEDATLFRYKETIDGKETEKDLTFPDFYDEDGEKVNTERLTDFVQKVMNWKKKDEENN